MQVEISIDASWHRYFNGRYCSILLWSFALMSLIAGSALAVQPYPVMDSDPFFKPLVDTAKRQEVQKIEPLEGHAEKQGTLPVNRASGLLITGKVQTLQQAIESERDVVDWYGWYMSAREYIGKTGGLRCALGTPIKFYRNGKMEALTFDTSCIASVQGRRFPLPLNTQLDALVLPVRPGQAPPATRDEIYSRLRIKSD
jgi:hypothetical protein